LYVILGVFKSNPLYAIPAVIGVLLGAVYLLRLFQRVFLGDFVYHGHEPLKDLGWRENISAASLVILIFWIGIRPGTVLRVMDASIDHLVKQVETNSKKAALSGRDRMAASYKDKLNAPAGGLAGLTPDSADEASAAHAAGREQDAGRWK
ncbi:MAG: hypothetical protein AAB307_02730, partial [Deltaproteobacteria bacterium]